MSMSMLALACEVLEDSNGQIHPLGLGAGVGGGNPLRGVTYQPTRSPLLVYLLVAYQPMESMVYDYLGSAGW